MSLRIERKWGEYFFFKSENNRRKACWLRYQDLALHTLNLHIFHQLYFTYQIGDVFMSVECHCMWVFAVMNSSPLNSLNPKDCTDYNKVSFNFFLYWNWSEYFYFILFDQDKLLLSSTGFEERYGELKVWDFRRSYCPNSLFFPVSSTARILISATPVLASCSSEIVGLFDIASKYTEYKSSIFVYSHYQICISFKLLSTASVFCFFFEIFL